jgi:hypothetical protein
MAYGGNVNGGEVASTSWPKGPVLLTAYAKRLSVDGLVPAGTHDSKGFDLHLELSLGTGSPRQRSPEFPNGRVFLLNAPGVMIVRDCGSARLLGGLHRYEWELMVEEWKGPIPEPRLWPLTQWIEAMGHFDFPSWHTHISAFSPATILADDTDTWELDSTPKDTGGGCGGRVTKNLRIEFWTRY